MKKLLFLVSGKGKTKKQIADEVMSKLREKDFFTQENSSEKFIPCYKCHQNQVRLPISNYKDKKTGETWHVPHFSPTICKECRKKS